MWRLPDKPQVVIEFERLKESGKEEIRRLSEYQEIKKYYDRCDEVIQHNVGEHAWRQQIGYEPVGKVEYFNGSFIKVLRDPIPKDQRWELGPDHFWHKPECAYRISNYKELNCECHVGRKMPRAQY